MTCRKRRFRTRVDAEIALASASMRGKRGNKSRRESIVYRCRSCHGWHLSIG